MWIPIPLVFATSLGLAALALDLPVTTDEADQGLIAVAAAQYVLGKGDNSVFSLFSITWICIDNFASLQFNFLRCKIFSTDHEP